MVGIEGGEGVHAYLTEYKMTMMITSSSSSPVGVHFKRAPRSENQAHSICKNLAHLVLLRNGPPWIDKAHRWDPTQPRSSWPP